MSSVSMMSIMWVLSIVGISRVCEIRFLLGWPEIPHNIRPYDTRPRPRFFKETIDDSVKKKKKSNAIKAQKVKILRTP